MVTEKGLLNQIMIIEKKGKFTKMHYDSMKEKENSK